MTQNTNITQRLIGAAGQESYDIITTNEAYNMLKDDHPELTKYWNYERNNAIGLSFEEMTSGSGKKAWWKCDKGHEWEAIIYNVTSHKSGCPYCSGRKAIPGVNDLFTQNPGLADEWNYDKNRGLSPHDVTAGSGKKVWWRCSKGHEWEAVISSRNEGVGCPYCAGRKVMPGFNDLATTHPELLAEWDYEKNTTIAPDNVSYGSEKRVWWRCSRGHEWEAMVGDRVRSRGCPYCSNRRVLDGGNTIDVTHPDVAKLWNYEKNGELKPSNITIGSGKIVWWKCDKGHEWKTAPYNIARGTGCPYCSNTAVLKGYNDLETVNPKLASEWNYEKNGDLTPSDIIAGSTKKVWWKCPRGHEWQAVVHSRNKNHSCPICNMYKVTSIPEKAIVFYLRRAGLLVEENKKILGKREVDIYLPEQNVAIEYDGQYWHQNNERDLDKNKLCHDSNIALLRIREPGLPTLNSTSLDYVLEKTNGDYTYMEPAIIWVLETIGTEGKDINIPRDIQEIYDLYNSSMMTESIETIPGIAERWDYDKNKINISSVSRWSDIKVWWRCNKCGHSYERSVANECSGARCPYCFSVSNDKKLLSIWNYDKNLPLKPEDIAAKSHKKVWWRCPKGHEWEAAPHNISNGSGCPYCANKRTIVGETDLLSVRPDIAACWNYEKNGGLKPTDATAGSGKKVWWRCPKGHEWEAAPNELLRGDGCPYCSGHRAFPGFNDLATTRKDLLKLWNRKKNGGLKPTDVTAGSGKKVWWRCPKGHEWEAAPNKVSNGRGCPYCANRKVLSGFNDLATTRSDLVKLWNYNRNDTLKPTDIMAGSGRKVWWRCPKGHEWEAAPNKVSNGRGCPYCANRKVLSGFNDLASTRKKLAAFWNYDKNLPLKPEDITAKSHKKVWWRCPKGHEWEAAPHDITNDRCPHCSK